MAKRKTARKPAARRQKAASGNQDLQRPAAETLYSDELARLEKADRNQPRPDGWNLAPRSVLRFVLGDDELEIAPKFVGQRSFLEPRWARSVGNA